MREIQSYYSITVVANVKNKTEINEINDNMSIFISYMMNSNRHLQDIHTGNGFKHYSYSTPFSKDNTLIGKCQFEIRTFSKDMAMSFISALTGCENDWLKVVSANLKEYSFGGKIKSVESITPSVLTIHPKILDKHNIRSEHRNTYWMSSMPLEILEQAIVTNLMSKYESLVGKSMGVNDTVKSISINNSMPIAVKYNSKKATLLGNKFKIEFNNGRDAQILARMAVVEGLLEKNAILGLGYVKPIYERVVG